MPSASSRSSPASCVALHPRLGASRRGRWLGGIIVNLLLLPGFYDVALRDFGLLLAAVALQRLATRFDPRPLTWPLRRGCSRHARPVTRKDHPVNPSLFRPEATPPAHHRTRTWSGTGAVAEPDLERAAAGARILLEALGVDLDNESLARTPERMAACLAELMSPRPFHLTTFPNDGGYDELIVAASIPLRSLCEHHMLPFVGTAHIGYLPGRASWALQAGSRPRALLLAPAGPGTADHPGRRLVAATSSHPAASAWSSRPSTCA